MFKKGYKPTQQHKDNLSKSIKDKISRLGYRYSKEICAQKSKMMKEKGLSPPDRVKFKKGHIPWNKGLKGVQTAWNKGMKGVFKHSEETKLRMSKMRSGEKGYQWITDRSKLKTSEHKHLDVRYGDWMKSVKNRDNWKCKIADENCKGRLEAHHILNWVNFPKLRYEVNNGISLCAFHHPRKRKDEIKLTPLFQELIVSN